MKEPEKKGTVPDESTSTSRCSGGGSRAGSKRKGFTAENVSSRSLVVTAHSKYNVWCSVVIGDCLNI